MEKEAFSINDCFHSYLTDFVQSTLKDPVLLCKIYISWSVPQGFVLGPFLSYINDIYRSSEKLKCSLFADDTNLSHAANDL